MDTGNTLCCLIAHLKNKGASSVSVCTLLDKPSRRKVNFELVGNGKYYCGFEVITCRCLFTEFVTPMLLHYLMYLSFARILWRTKALVVLSKLVQFENGVI